MDEEVSALAALIAAALLAAVPAKAPSRISSRRWTSAATSSRSSAMGRDRRWSSLDSGFSTPRSAWYWVVPRLRTTTRVCSYDRAGLGPSGPAGVDQADDRRDHGASCARSSRRRNSPRRTCSADGPSAASTSGTTSTATPKRSRGSCSWTGQPLRSSSPPRTRSIPGRDHVHARRRRGAKHPSPLGRPSRRRHDARPRWTTRRQEIGLGAGTAPDHELHVELDPRQGPQTRDTRLPRRTRGSSPTRSSWS